MANQPFDYLGGKNWNDITRDERTFCAHVYEAFRHSPDQLIEIITSSNHNPANFPSISELSKQKDWSLHYEVCFYRDLLKSKGEGVKLTVYPDKRTWDLALFSEDSIIIIEAKAHENLDRNQLKDLCLDKWGKIPKELTQNNVVQKQTEETQKSTKVKKYSVQLLIESLFPNRIEVKIPKVYVVLLMPEKFCIDERFPNEHRLSGQFINKPLKGEDQYLADALISWKALSKGAEGINKQMILRANEV